MTLACYWFLTLRKKNSGTSFYCAATLVIALLTLGVTRPAMPATEDAPTIGDDQRQLETAPEITRNWISKLKLPKSAYEVNDSISNLLGIQFSNVYPNCLVCRLLDSIRICHPFTARIETTIVSGSTTVSDKNLLILMESISVLKSQRIYKLIWILKCFVVTE